MSKPQRNSNFELLRIVSMLIIILYHFLIHTVIPNNPSAAFILKPVITLLHIGVICFVLISGYWGIRFTTKGLINLLVQCIFYSLLIYVTACIFTPLSFSIAGFAKAFIPFQWWYIQIYLCLFLLSPMVNNALKNATAKEKIVHIGLLTLVSSVLGFMIPGLENGRNPINFILIYYIGNYLRHHLTFKASAKKLTLYYTIFVIAMFLSLLFLSQWPTLRDFIFTQVFFQYNAIGLLFASALVFAIFGKINLQSTVVNHIANSVLAVYLIHENTYLSSYMYQFIGSIQQQLNSTIAYSLFLLGATLAVFFACIGIDKLCKPLINWLIELLVNRRGVVRFQNFLDNNAIK